MQRQGNVNFQMNRSTEILLPRARTDKKCRNYTLALVMVILLLGAIVGGKLTYDYWLENRWIDIEECRIDDCGKVGPDFISSRIIGGSDARVDEFPFQVAITLMDDSKVYCGGNMINDRWILTAAHCLRLSGDMQVKKSAIRVSVAILKTSEVRSNSIGIDDYFVHPNYDPEKGKKYDIALIKTSQPIPSNSKRYTNPICLPFDNNDSEDAQIAQVVGFGLRQQDAQESSDTLRKTKVSLLSSTECYRTYYLNYDASSMICAGVSRRYFIL